MALTVAVSYLVVAHASVNAPFFFWEQVSTGPAATRELQKKLDDWRKEQELQRRFREARSEHFIALFERAGDEPLARDVMARLEAAYQRIGGPFTYDRNRADLAYGCRGHLHRWSAVAISPIDTADDLLGAMSVVRTTAGRMLEPDACNRTPTNDAHMRQLRTEGPSVADQRTERARPCVDDARIRLEDSDISL